MVNINWDLIFYIFVTQALLGNRYGYRPFPAKIPVTEFSTFSELAIRHKIDVSALRLWFRCDSNATPPVYQLQPIITHFPHYTSHDPQLRQQDRAGWWETFLHLQNLFWKLVDLAVRENRMTLQRAHVYLQSGISIILLCAICKFSVLRSVFEFYNSTVRNKI